MAKKIKSDFYELSLRKGDNSDFSDFKDILNNLANKIYNKRYGLKEENIFHFFKFEKNLKNEIINKLNAELNNLKIKMHCLEENPKYQYYFKDKIILVNQLEKKMRK